MHHYFIVEKTFEHMIECFCPDGAHEDSIEIKKADIIEVTNDRQYMSDNGWYIKVFLNNYWHFHIALEDLEKYFTQGMIVSLVDLELKINHLNYLIDQSLSKGDKFSFLQSTKRLKESKYLKLNLESYLSREAENLFMS
ncbi:hypothetical protein [Metabacillus litoralis]|uniref:hypothetical protein n=1 Tax=Metabacillus litoralis TaxID=152268 RepID=UPI001CFF4B77|nr:hypothetical protein [Metabacillus litoralis]